MPGRDIDTLPVSHPLTLPSGRRLRASAIAEERRSETVGLRLSVRASSIDVDARVTSLDPRGKREAAATKQRDPGRPARSGSAPVARVDRAGLRIAPRRQVTSRFARDGSASLGLRAGWVGEEAQLVRPSDHEGGAVSARWRDGEDQKGRVRPRMPPPAPLVGTILTSRGRRTNQTGYTNLTTADFADLVRAAQAGKAGPP